MRSVASSWLSAIAIASVGCASIGDPPSDTAPPETGPPYVLPAHVIVRPVFFVASDQAAPTTEQKTRLGRHLAWAQQRYREMLDSRDTFELDTAVPEIVRGAKPVAEYLKLADLGASEVMAELLAHEHHTRFDNPFVFVTVMMNNSGAEPSGYGRPCNGGLDGGGGLLLVSSTTLASMNFQSTLQHELGHAFGLPHVEAYGYDMASNPSIMSYNVAHWTRDFEPSPTPGTLIPEDLHALAMNDRVFGALSFDRTRDLPSGYDLANVVPLPAMDVPGQPPNLVATATPSGELYGSTASRAVQGRLLPSVGPGITFDPDAMWHSDIAPTGEVTLDIVFPIDVSLNEIRVHSQHSGLYHAATAVGVEAQVADSDFVAIAAQPVAVDDRVRFPATSARVWRLAFQAGESGMVVVRGLQFFSDGSEIFPPFVPEP